LSLSSLCVVTCGSVDDGKSTLLGRLLHDTGSVPDDQLATLANESHGRPCGPEGLDLSLLVDGLEAEREQGITIDVAYRQMTTANRRIVFADSPGHEQYTRNMMTAASHADAAILLVDARKGLSMQTRRHAAILSLLGIRHVALVVNKMDLVGFARSAADAIATALTQEHATLAVTVVPTSALTGANVVRRAPELGWHTGPTLIEWLDSIPVEAAVDRPLVLPVQWVNRGTADFRGLAGRIGSGRLRRGDRVATARAGQASTVKRLIVGDRDVEWAETGDSVTVVLEEPIDAGRGDVLGDPSALPTVTDQFVATLVWFDTKPLMPHRSYLMRLGTSLVPADVTALSYRLGLEKLDRQAAKQLAMNEIGRCNIALASAVALAPFREDRGLGRFILIDRVTRDTVAAGVIEHPLRRAENIRRQTYDLTPARRAAQKGHKPAIVWFTGLSGSGKSTVANLVDRKLHAMGRHTFILDGDNLRHGLNRDLNFTDVDRIENVRRAAEVARLMADAGLIVLVALISPFRQERALARRIAGDVPFVEAFVDADLATCERRDPKGLYAKARQGKIPNFTGIGSPYERPETPDITLDTGDLDPETCADAMIALLI
jgi:bifunctional enzyme CysN/CysC